MLKGRFLLPTAPLRFHSATDRTEWLVIRRFENEVLMSLRKLTYAFIAIALLASAWRLASSKPVAHAQQAQAADTSTVIKAETRLVLVDTVVTDKKGNYITDLTQ